MDKSIKELDSDFVITYADKSNERELTSFLNLLYDKGFYTQVRDLDEASLLIFIKLSSYKLTELYQKDLLTCYEFGVTTSSETKADKIRIIYDYLSGNVADDLNILTHKYVKSVTQISPSISKGSAVNDIKDYLLSWKNPSTQFIKENFGTLVALYFEFFKFFIVWLSGLAILGILSYVKSKHTFSLTFCIINLIWGTLFLTLWNKREKYLVSYWGESNYHLIEINRAKLADINEPFEEKSTFKDKNSYGGYKFLKQLVFIPVALVFAAILISYQLGCFVLEIFFHEIYDGPYKMFIGLVPTILISAFIPILSIIFNKVSDILIKFENHKSEYTKSNSIIFKQFVLNFLTSYMPLIITSFIYLPFAHLIQPDAVRQTIESHIKHDAFYYRYLTHIKRQNDFNMNQDRLNLQFHYFIVTNQIIQLVLKYGLPQIIGLAMKFLKKETYSPNDKANEKDWLNNLRRYISLPTYNANDDFRYLAITYGYIILFGPVWSLAPLFVLIFFIITLKLDYLKLLNGKYFKPPIPEKVDSIFPWNYALFALTWLSSIISPAITAFYHHGVKPPKTAGQFALDKASINTKSSSLVLILLTTEHSFLIVWFLLNKIFSLFKSEVEWADDFTDKDIKLRHDYYSSKVVDKVMATEQNDGEWVSLTPEDALAQANSVKSGKFSSSVDDSDEVTKEAGSLTGIQKNTESELKNLKNKTDEIITTHTFETDSHGNIAGSKVVSTIDDNSHIDYPAGTTAEYQKDYEAENRDDDAAGQGVDVDKEAVSEASSNHTEGDSTPLKSSKSSKKSPLKKIFKKK